MTDEEILFDFFSIARNRELAHEVEEEHTANDPFELPPINPGESRSFEVKADKKEFEEWLKKTTGRSLATFLARG